VPVSGYKRRGVAPIIAPTRAKLLPICTDVTNVKEKNIFEIKNALFYKKKRLYK